MGTEKVEQSGKIILTTLAQDTYMSGATFTNMD